MAKSPKSTSRQPKSDPQKTWWDEERKRQNIIADTANKLGITIHVPADTPDNEEE